MTLNSGFFKQQLETDPQPEMAPRAGAKCLPRLAGRPHGNCLDTLETSD